MIGYRWLRAAARGAVGLLTALPAAALVLAVLVDRGTDGELRGSLVPPGPVRLRPVRLDVCAEQPDLRRCRDRSSRSSEASAWVGILARRRSWGRGAGRAAVASLLAAAPAVLALGFLGIGSTPRLWPWPHSLRDATTGGLSLESWQGLPLWGLWIWSSLPCASPWWRWRRQPPCERVEPAWLDAARLAGAGPLRTWHRLTWPLVRPAAARAAAIVFPLALFEPGVPLILGLRRTLAFQIVEAAARPAPFPRIAVWTVMAAVFSMAGRWLLRWWGGPTLPGRGGSGAGTACIPDPLPAGPESHWPSPALRSWPAPWRWGGCRCLG